MLKHILLSSAMAAAALSAPALSQAADVGVSISIGQPGFYGTIDIGNTRPDVIYAQPVLVQRVPSPPPPIYLRVSPGHEKHWNRYCAQYNACGRPVYFVKDTWYRNVYAPQYRRDHPHGPGPDWRDDHRPGQGPGNGRGPDRRDDRKDDHRGNDHRGGDNRGNDHRGDRNDDRGPDHDRR